MTPSRTRMTSRRVAIAVASAVLILGISGCAAPADTSGDAQRSAMPSAVKTPTPPPASAQTEATLDADVVTCAAFGDVLTILHNTRAAFYEDRMGEKELGGWHSLASRFLGNIPSADEGPIAEALASFKVAVPAVPFMDPTNVDTDEWLALGYELRDACPAAGFEVVGIGFTGG